MKRYSIVIAGESGSGLVTSGEIMIQALIAEGYHIVADREYPSLIRGGYACYKIQFSDTAISGLSKENDMLICVDRIGLKNYFSELKEGGILIHGDERHEMMKDICETVKEKNYNEIYLPERQTVYEIGGNLLMTNILMIGVAWQALGFSYETIQAQVEKKFASKPALLKLDLKCLELGYNLKSATQISLNLFTGNNKNNTQVFDGNYTLSLGAIRGGMTHYYAYPMSPSSSILTYIASLAKEHNITLKQGEDEISIVQMALGSMHVGARSLCATSGGGFDLMAETVSLAGIIETPLVVINVQRPGPATGLPTWTAQADLDMVVYSGHGEYAKMVYAISDPEHAYYGIVEAMNFAEEYHIPVIVLSDKTIAETHVTLPDFDDSQIEIKRGITEGADILSSSERYSYTYPLGKRWLPGSSDHVYYANGDEHREDGTLCEDETGCQNMAERRIQRMQILKDALPKPKILGDEIADISFIGWGSTKMIMKDMLKLCEEENISCNYLHFNVVFPLEESVLESFMKHNTNIHLIEGNLTGQLGKQIEQLGYLFNGKILKCDGRPFYIGEVMDYINSNK